MLMFRLDAQHSVLTQLATGNKNQIFKNHESITKLEYSVEDLKKTVTETAKTGKKLIDIVEKESSDTKEKDVNFRKKLYQIEENNADFKKQLEKIVRMLQQLENQRNATRFQASRRQAMDPSEVRLISISSKKSDFNVVQFTNQMFGYSKVCIEITLCLS